MPFLKNKKQVHVFWCLMCFNSSTIQLHSGTGNRSEGHRLLTATNTLHARYHLLKSIAFFLDT